MLMIMIPEEMKDWKGPFHFDVGCLNPMRCMRLQDGRFHVFESGEPAVLLTGSDFILAQDPILSILKKLCANKAEFKDATVMQTVKETTWSGYCEIIPHEEILPDTIDCIDYSGFNLWRYGRGNLFVSLAVKNELLNSNIKGVSFTPGFSGFASVPIKTKL